MVFIRHSKSLVDKVEKIAKSLLVGAMFKGKKFTPTITESLP
ncbi:MAG: hypothetical protein ACFFD2_12560 [Promethearchaeota archaeon]